MATDIMATSTTKLTPHNLFGSLGSFRSFRSSFIKNAPRIARRRGERYGKAADVYSFGVLLFALTVEKGDVYLPFTKAAASDDGAMKYLVHDPSAREVKNENLVSDKKEEEAGLKKKGMTPLTVMKHVAENEVRPEVGREVLPSIRALIHSCWSNLFAIRPSFENIVEILDGRVRSEVQLAAMSSEQKRGE